MAEAIDPPRTCPNPNLGDIQLETVLTPLLFPKTRPGEGRIWTGSPDDTHPVLRLLDFGCGDGRLVRAMEGFPDHILRHFEYVGCDPDPSALARAQALLGPDSRLARQLRKAAFSDWRDLRRVEKEYDFVFMVNVLHHVRPDEFPLLFLQISQMVKDGAALVIHDLCFADKSSMYDLSKYCADGIFFGPEHVASFFAMASTQTGLYRTMRRGNAAASFDLFTFILYFDNELSHESYQTSVWYDDYFSYVLIPPGLVVSLEDIELNCERPDSTGWFGGYRARVRYAREAVERRWSRWLEDEVTRDAARSWVDGRAGRPTSASSRRARDARG